ncbi:MAG: restriction endonuclease subunit S [Crocinitomicaceae bacterium]|nr:restriction endonuclease subunit S [Crocinitomicaceae bacterium]
MTEQVKITDVCDFQGGTQPPKSVWKKDFQDGYIRMLQIRDFTQPEKDNVEYVPIKKTLKTCQEKDILIGRYGASVGKICTGLSGAFNVALIKTIPNTSKISREYLLHLLRGSTFQNFILNVGSRAAQAGFNKDDLEGFEFALPPLNQQKKIAAILDTADAYRQKTKALIDKYDELTQSLFLDMFGDTWINPKGWKVYKIEDLAVKEKHGIKAGPFGSSLKKEFYVESGYKIYGQEQVIRDDLQYGDYYIDQKKFEELESCKIGSGDILISLVGTYGKISVVPERFEPGIINPRLMKISPNKEIIRPDFLKKLLQSSGVAVQMKNQSRGGTMDIVNVGIMKGIKVPLPPLELQNQFAERLQAIEAQKGQAQASLNKAEELFNSLLQRAFKGELV